MARVKIYPKSPHPRGFEASLSDTPVIDLKDYLIKKRSIHQITSQCSCKWLIMAVLSKCHYNSHMNKSSVFNWLSAVPISNSAKRRLSCKKKSFSDVEYPEVTSNMVGPCTISSKSNGKQSVVCSDESDDESSSGLKEILNGLERVYQHICIQTGTIAAVNYSALPRGIYMNEVHPTITKL